MEPLVERKIIDKTINYIEGSSIISTFDIYILKYNDKTLRLPSGKSSWKKKSHAISAFTNFLSGLIHTYRDGWTPGKVTKLLIEKGILKIVKIT